MKKLLIALKRLRNWWNLPPSCKIHGRAHLYQHGYEAEWQCYRCTQELIKKV